MTKQLAPLPQDGVAALDARRPVDVDSWAMILADAAVFADALEVKRLDALVRRLQLRRLRVLVAGEAKRGKSTLVNALLGRLLLPTGVTPLTSVVTTVTAVESGLQEYAKVFFTDGTGRRIALDDLPAFVTESGNPGNAAGVTGVTVHIQSKLLENYRIDLVDTPGTGSVYTQNTTDARHALTSLDAAILVLTADPPISDAERNLLAEISHTSVRTFVLLNKIDRLNHDEIREAEAFTRRVCREAIGQEVPVQSCSARRGYDDPGFTAFSTSLTGYLDTRADQDVQIALLGHVTRTLQTMLDGRRIRMRGLELAAGGQERELEDLRLRLRSVAGRRTDINDRCIGSLGRMRADLDRSAAAVVSELTHDCRRALNHAWESELERVAPGVVEDQALGARGVVIGFLTRAVDAWRAERIADLEAGLTGVVEQAQADLTTQVQLARDSIQDVLAIRLHGSGPEPKLQVDMTFHYDFTRPESWQWPLQTVISRFGTTTVRRNRARRTIFKEIPTLTDRQVGRARSDLQHRLQETERAIRRALDEQFTQSIDVFLELLAGLTRDGEQGRTQQVTEHERIATEARSLEALLARV